MITLKYSNINEVYKAGILLLKEQGVLQASQHGNTLEMPEPCSVMYLNPRERILFDATRDSNPFLNLFEALWILAGRNDVKFLQELVGKMATYSDDGVTYYGAYGHRMRNVDTGYADQIERAISRLKYNPDDRQVVITIRDRKDMGYTGKDQPCNLLVSCKIRQGKLNIHVFNRSNDFVWGLAGTNVVQFSMLQEYLAGRIGCEVGFYHQTTDSMHVYTNDQWDLVKDARPNGILCPYGLGQTSPFPMMQEDAVGDWDHDLHTFFEHYDKGVEPGIEVWLTPFFKQVVHSAWYSFLCWKDYRDGTAETAEHPADTPKNPVHLIAAKHISEDVAADWGLAMRLWLGRRGQK